MKNTIFFDFNGTIINDVDLCLDILNKMLVANNKQPITKEHYLSIFRFPIQEYYQLAGFDFNERSFEDLSHDFIKLYQQASLNCPLYDGVVDVLKELKAKNYHLVLLSASQIDNLKQQVKHFNLEPYFDAILGIDDIFARSKVDIGLKYLNDANITKEDAIMLGDTLHDKEVASKLGIDICLFTKGHQSKEVLSTSNVLLVDSYSEFLRVILNEKNN